MKPRFITHDGRMLSLMGWERETGLNHRTISHRLGRGMSIAEALSSPLIIRPAKLFTLNGESLTADEWGKRIGLSGKAVWCRLYKGWTLERALTTPKVAPSQRRAPRQAATKRHNEGNEKWRALSNESRLHLLGDRRSA